MMSHEYLRDGRALLLASRHTSVATVGEFLSAPFAAMVPAFGVEDQSAAEAVMGAFVDRGCVEICCVGPDAESLHDGIDSIIEDKKYFDIVTTWHEDQYEAAEYFVLAAGGKSPMLVAFVQEQPQLAALLRTVATEAG